MTGLSHYADYTDYTSSEPDMAITYTYDAFDRQVDEDDAAGGFDQRTIWDGTTALEMLNGSDGVTQRFLNGPAVDQVLAAEQVGGSYAETNWLLADGAGNGSRSGAVLRWAEAVLRAWRRSTTSSTTSLGNRTCRKRPGAGRRQRRSVSRAC